RVNRTPGLSGETTFHMRKPGYGALSTSTVPPTRLIIHEGKVAITGRVTTTNVVSSLEIPQINVTTPANTNTGGAVSSIPPPHGTLDLGQTKMIVRSGNIGTWDSILLKYQNNTIIGDVQSGYHAGNWDGPGIN